MARGWQDICRTVFMEHLFWARRWAQREKVGTGLAVWSDSLGGVDGVMVPSLETVGRQKAGL